MDSSLMDMVRGSMSGAGAPPPPPDDAAPEGDEAPEDAGPQGEMADPVMEPAARLMDAIHAKDVTGMAQALKDAFSAMQGEQAPMTEEAPPAAEG
jgi:hypothetical protein